MSESGEYVITITGPDGTGMTWSGYAKNRFDALNLVLLGLETAAGDD